MTRKLVVGNVYIINSNGNVDGKRFTKGQRVQYRQRKVDDTVMYNNIKTKDISLVEWKADYGMDNWYIPTAMLYSDDKCGDCSSSCRSEKGKCGLYME